MEGEGRESRGVRRSARERQGEREGVDGREGNGERRRESVGEVGEVKRIGCVGRGRQREEKEEQGGGGARQRVVVRSCQ
eukprot:scaffold208403_cov30-Tisochrysis_lutea.AAC.4